MPLRSPSPEVRAGAAETLGYLRAYSAAPALVAALKDSSAAVRREAALSLAWCGGRTEVPALLETLDDADWSVRQAAWVSLTNLTGMEWPYDALAPPDVRRAQARTWRQWWSSVRPGDVPKDVLDLLGADYKYVTGYRGLAKVTAGVLQNETQYSCGSVPNYRSMVEPNLIKPGKAITMWYYSPTDADGNEVKFSDLAGIPTFLEIYKRLRGGAPTGVKAQALRLVNNLSTYMLRGSFVPGGTPKAAVDALRAAWQAMPGDKAFVAEYKKAFKADPKILQADEAQAHVNRVKSLDPKVVDFLKKFTRGAG